MPPNADGIFTTILAIVLGGNLMTAIIYHRVLTASHFSLAVQEQFGRGFSKGGTMIPAQTTRGLQSTVEVTFNANG